MRRKLVLWVAVLLLLVGVGGAAASPRPAIISTYSVASWLPAEVDKKACEIIDDGLMASYDAILFDGSKTADKKEMAKHIGPAFADYVISVQHTGFYDPPHTAAHLSSDVKPDDTVATVILDYSVYVTAADKWVTGRVYQRVVFVSATVPREAACLVATRQVVPKLREKLGALVK